MSRVLVNISLLAGLVCLLLGCHENESYNLISGQVICQGGCFSKAYYANITDNALKGKAQVVTDNNGVSRGQFNNVVIINNLKSSDQQEGKTIFFKNFKDTEVSCQSSYPRAVREIDIAY